MPCREGFPRLFFFLAKLLSWINKGQSWSPLHFMHCIFSGLVSNQHGHLFPQRSLMSWRLMAKSCLSRWCLAAMRWCPRCSCVCASSTPGSSWASRHWWVSVSTWSSFQCRSEKPKRHLQHYFRLFRSLSVAVLSLGSQVLMAKIISKLRHKSILLTDSRVRTMNEILNSIKLIKMYAWEESFEEKIAGRVYMSGDEWQEFTNRVYYASITRRKSIVP